MDKNIRIEKNWGCPKCKKGTLRLDSIGGYLKNPWGFFVRCDNCKYEIYYDNPNYDESQAIYNKKGERLG